MKAQSLSSKAATNLRFHPVVTVTTESLSLPRPQSLAEGAGLAHDAGNLLGALGLYSDLLHAPGVLRPEHRHYAAELRLLSQRSSALIRRLLANSGNTPVAEAPEADSLANPLNNPISDPAVTLRALEPLLARIAAPQATLALEIGQALPALPFSAEILERIVLNLVRNAAEALSKQLLATPRNPDATASNPPEPAGHIRIALQTDNDRSLRLEIEDNGPGLDMRTAAAFLHNTTATLDTVARGSGTETRGLGHRIVHELTQTSAAELEIKVRPNHGTTFVFLWKTPSL